MFVITSRPVRSRLCVFVCLLCIHAALRAKLTPYSVPLKAGLKHWRTHWLSNDHWSARASARGLAHPHHSDIDWTLGSLFSLRPAGSMSKSITAASTPHSDKKRERRMEFLVFLLLLSSSLAFLLDPPPLLCQRVRVTPGRRSSSNAVADDISIEFPFGQSRALGLPLFPVPHISTRMALTSSLTPPCSIVDVDFLFTQFRLSFSCFSHSGVRVYSWCLWRRS